MIHAKQNLTPIFFAEITQNCKIFQKKVLEILLALFLKKVLKFSSILGVSKTT